MHDIGTVEGAMKFPNFASKTPFRKWSSSSITGGKVVFKQDSNQLK